MEGYTLRQQPLAALRGNSPLLRLASDERLVELTRRGQQAAYEALVSRYQARLLAFCRHMLGSREDAEDVLQEVFAAAYNALRADSRTINVRPWLYRIARNRSLNHLRRITAIGVDSMDLHFADAGSSTSDKAHKREEFRLLLDDIAHLPESQRSALVLREMDALTYEQIAEAMDTTVPSVKSLLVRARIGLAEAAEARKLTCDEVRLELGAAAEGVASLSPPVRRHIKGCEGCRNFRSHLRANNKALAAIFPLGPLVLLKKMLLAKLGLAKFGGAGAGASASAGGATAGGATAGGAAAGGAVASGTAAVATGGGMGTFTVGALGVKAAVVAATAAVAAVAVSVHSTKPLHIAPPPTRNVASVQSAPQVPPAAYPPSEPGPAAVVVGGPGRRHRRLGQGVLAPGAHMAVHRRLMRTAGVPSGAHILAVENAATVSGAGAVAPSGATAPTAALTTPSAATVVPPAGATTAPTTQYLATTTTYPGEATGPTGPVTSPSTQEVDTTSTFASGSTSATTTQEITTTTVFGSTGSTAPVGPTAATGPTSSTGSTSVTGPTSSTGLTSATGATGATAATGSTGATSGTGATGRTGGTGQTGSTTSTGATGATGDTFGIEPSGTTGATGVGYGTEPPSGASGATGLALGAATTEPTGSTSTTESTSATGATSASGASGSTGP